MERKDRKGSRAVLSGLFLTASIAISGCGGGGGGGGGGATPTTEPTSGGSGAALQLAEKISVVDASSGSGGGAAPLRIGKFQVRPSVFGTATTEWDRDRTVVYVEERSAESFDIINEILCMVDQSQYDAMVNKGSYRAQVDMNQCARERDSASSAGQESQNQSSGSTMPDYEWWTVNSYRADNASPHTVKVWVHEEARHEGDHYEPAKVIQARVTITEGKSDTNPYGIFTLNFKAHPLNLDGSLNTNLIVMFKGYLRSYKNAAGKVLLEFIVDGGFDSERFIEKVALDRAPDGSAGSGTTFNSYSSAMWGGHREKFNFAFNQANFKRQDAFTNASTTCLDRANFDQTAWRYGLYDSNGARVTRNSGFPIKFNGYHGWVGYWGLWLPEGGTVSDGATVYRQVYTANAPPTEAPYTVMMRGGKLKKHTQKLMTLADIKNIPLDYWDQGTNYRAVWNGAAFTIAAKQNQTNWTWEQCGGAVTCPASIDLTKLTWDTLNFWSQALGGNVQVKLNCGTTWPPVCSNTTSAGDTSKVIFYAEDIVYPGEFATTVTLSCYDDHSCPDPNAFATITDTNTTNDNPYFTNQITIPTATITVDGGTVDWTGITALATDPTGDTSTGAKTGADITALYAAKDANNLYIRLDLSAAANTTFGNGPSPNDGSYRFQIESNSSAYPFLGVGVAYDSTNGQWQVGGNGSSGPAPALLQNNPNLVGVTGSTIEIKIPLTDIGSPTVFKSITAEANSCCSQPMGQPPTAWDIAQVLVKHDYTFDPTAAGMVLVSGTTPVVLTGTINSQQYQWGVWSAPLFEPTSANLALLACDWDPGRTCGWKAWSALPVFYTWETGPAQWSRLTLLKDLNGIVLKFEAPLQVQYTHTQTDTGALDYKYNGSNFYLEYSGFGELHGIPGTCVDMDTGQPANCGPNTRWVAEFMMPEGATVTSNATTYYVKPLEVEQRMRKAAASNCSALAIAPYTLPDMTLWSDPNIGAEPTTVPPLISDAPAVIGGVVQPGF